MIKALSAVDTATSKSSINLGNNHILKILPHQAQRRQVLFFSLRAWRLRENLKI